MTYFWVFYLYTSWYSGLKNTPKSKTKQTKVIQNKTALQISCMKQKQESGP